MRQTLKNVAENLWKSQQSGRYDAILKVNGRQVKKSLKTDDYQLAKRKLRELERDYQERAGIVGSEPPPKSFKELVAKFTRIVLPTRRRKTRTHTNCAARSAACNWGMSGSSYARARSPCTSSPAPAMQWAERYFANGAIRSVTAAVETFASSAMPRRTGWRLDDTFSLIVSCVK